MWAPLFLRGKKYDGKCEPTAKSKQESEAWVGKGVQCKGRELTEVWGRKDRKGL